MSNQIEKEIKPKLEWLQLKKNKSATNDDVDEAWGNRVVRKFSAAPLIPIGMAATCAALGYGLISFKRGDKKMQQYMMRARVIAQGFTIAVAIFTLMIKPRTHSDESEQPKKEAEKAV